MALVALTTLLPQITPYVPGASTAVTQQWLQRAAVDFATDTEIWREDLASFDTVADQADYTLALPSGYTNVVFQRVRKVEVDEFQIAEGAWEFSSDGVLTFDPIPNESGKAVVCSVTFRPVEDCTSYPDWLLDRWGQGIACGTVAQMARMDKMPWSSDRNARMFGERYRTAVAQALVEKVTQRQSGDIRIDSRPFV